MSDELNQVGGTVVSAVGASPPAYEVTADWSNAQYVIGPWSIKTKRLAQVVQDIIVLPLAARVDPRWFDQFENLVESEEAQPKTSDPCRLAGAREESALWLYDMAVDFRPERLREYVDRLVAKTNGLVNDGGWGYDVRRALLERYEVLAGLTDRLADEPSTANEERIRQAVEWMRNE